MNNPLAVVKTRRACYISPPMKVMLATPSLHPDVGGPAATVSTVGTLLAARGVEPMYWTASGRLYGAIGAKGSMSRVFSTDVIHNFGLWRPFNHWVSFLAHFASKPIVTCTMGMLEPWPLTQRALRKRVALSMYQRKALDKAQALHATSEVEVRNLRLLGLRAPIALIPHGSDVPTTLPPCSGDTAPHRAVRTAVFVSRIHPKKGVLDLVRTWARLRPEGWCVVIVGPDDGGHRAQVERAVADAKLEHAFSFTGRVSAERKREILLNADLFVLPTYSENFGQVVPEALGHGLPVITTTGAPWSELVETRSGWWVEPGEAGLQGALEQALALSISELRAMGLRGREMVMARYSWDAVIIKHLALYRWLVHKDLKPDFVHD